MTSLFMWRQSAGRAVKVGKVKGEEAGVLQKHTHTSSGDAVSRWRGNGRGDEHTRAQITEWIPAAWHHAAAGVIEGTRSANQEASRGRREWREGRREGGSGCISCGRPARIARGALCTKWTLNQRLHEQVAGVWLQCNRFSSISSHFQSPCWTKGSKKRKKCFGS